MKKLYYNADFFSMEAGDSKYKAVLCEDSIIQETFYEVPANIDCEMIDLGGGFVFPGFIDSHTHSFEGGLYQNGVDLSSCESMSDVLDYLREATHFGGMVFAWKFDENHILEGRFPTKLELDKVLPHIPLLLRRIDGHSCVINSCGETLIKKLSPSFVCEDNVLRGSQNDLAAHTFHRNLSIDAVFKCYETAQSIALQNGFTDIHTMIGDAKDDFLHFDKLLNKLDKFIIDWTLYPQCFDIKAVAELPASPKILSPRIGGCILADGSFGSHTAAISEPYIDDLSNYGTLYQSDIFWHNFICEAVANNLSVGVHCIGDRAINQIVKAILSCSGDVPNTDHPIPRHQIIHCELVTDDMLPAMQRAGIHAVMQPMFDALWGGDDGFYSSVLGIERVKFLNRFKTLTDSGIVVTGGSDWYITDLSALKGIDAAINHHNKNERLSHFEAIKLYTTNPPMLSFEEDIKGFIKKNYRADFVCLDKNIMTTSDIAQAKVLYTIKNGDIVYEQ